MPSTSRPTDPRPAPTFGLSMCGVVLLMMWKMRSAVIGRFVGKAVGHASVTLPSANVPAPRFASAPSMDECASGGSARGSTGRAQSDEMRGSR